MMAKKKKSYSIEKVADLYLAELAKEVDPPPFLSTILIEKNIFYDNELLKGTIMLLRDKKFITNYRQGTRSKMIVISYARNKNAAPPEERKLLIEHYKITDVGWHFVSNGQEIDLKGKAERAEEHKKWKERAITSGIAVLVSIATMAIKWFLFDRK